jgi:acetyl esterase/lipase
MEAGSLRTVAYRTVAYKMVGGHEILLDVYRPEGESAAPVVVWIHGGALIMGSREQIHGRRGLLDLCSSKGLAVVAIDYRLAPETKLPEILTDVQDAFAWIRNEGPAYGLDGDRIGVMGHSAGGYLALMCGVVVQPRPRAIVSFYGYGDIVGEWYAQPDPFYNQLAPISDAEARSAVGTMPLSAPDELENTRRGRFYLWTRQRGLWPREVGGKDPVQDRAAFGPWCSVQHVDRDWPPTLLLHGTADTDVPYAQSALMDEALRQAGVSTRLITIDDGPHGFERGVTLADLTAADQTAVGRACAESIEFLAGRL